MKKTFATLTTATIAGALAIGGATAANAEDQPYTIVAWTIPGGDINNHFAQPQQLFTHQQIGALNLGALDGVLECGTAYQVDIYNTSEQTDKVIGNGFLNGANAPFKEDHVKWDGSTWKVFSTDACVSLNEPLVETSDWVDESIECDATAVLTRREHTTTTYELDKVANVNVANEPTVKVESGERELSAEEIAANKCPIVPVEEVTPEVGDASTIEAPATVAKSAPVAELAYTGSNDVNPAPLLTIGGLLVAAGAFLMTRKKKSA